jgi:3-hydroxybutyryl-CoA dehydrogenase
MNKCADADLVIEALAEDIKVKAEFFSELDAICSPSAFLPPTRHLSPSPR